MAITDESNGFYMPVQPAYGAGNNGGYGGFGGDWAWIILLLLLGWGNNGWGNRGNAGSGDVLYPWMNQADLTNSGFRDQMINGNINEIRSGINSISTQLCNGFAGNVAAISGAQNAISGQMYNDTIANLERSFATQTAITGGVNNLSTQLAQCCCDNRSATQDLKYVIATENCADRAALSDGVRDIIAAQTASTQRILDQLCSDKIDAKNDTIAQLRQELLYARGQASQDVQTARLLAGQTAEVDALYNRLNNCPVGTVPVYGRQPIFTCNNNGCGCGCGN